MQIHNNFATSLFLFFSVPFFLSLVRDERDLIYESPPHGAPASAEHRYHTHALFSSTYSSLPSTWPGVRPGRKASSSILFISDNLTRPILQPTQSIYSCQPSLSPFLSDPPGFSSSTSHLSPTVNRFILRYFHADFVQVVNRLPSSSSSSSSSVAKHTQGS